MGLRPIGRRACAVALATLVLLGAGCQALVSDHVNYMWAAVGQPPLPDSDYLRWVAFARAGSACGSGDTRPIDPMTVYTGEPVVAMVERLAAEPFDCTLDPNPQEMVATEAIWVRWRDDPPSPTPGGTT